MITQVKETVPGVVGNCTSASAFTLAWVTMNVLPWLHLLSVAVGILASGGTAVYYFVQWRNGRHKPRRKIVRRRKK